MELGLLLIFLVVLIIPLTVKIIERNMEMFLLFMGGITVIISNVLNWPLFITAATDPIKITLAVFGAGLIFKWLQTPTRIMVAHVRKKVRFTYLVFFLVVILGVVSSLITAIIAALVLVFIISELELGRKDEVRLAILACFSIGLGAAISPIGEPLSTIAISKLNEDIFYLFKLIGKEVLLALFIFGVLAAIFVKDTAKVEENVGEINKKESYEDILVRALKVYFFIMGLTFLGAGFEPIISTYFLSLDPSIIYWLNMTSAVLDNATLTAAELSPELEDDTVRVLLLGLLISGGMLVPGNIPNIIASTKLRITSKEWAMCGVPLGLIMLVFYFFFVL
ncbi:MULTISPECIES: DUF1646 family protein [Bacillus]|uniref:DUF1646 family protein n=1 Tax=Bacillus TaxID=1386 RepID=UPI000BB6A48B|nr:MULTISPECIES: DUF1646 family protein [Bacillus]